MLAAVSPVREIERVSFTAALDRIAATDIRAPLDLPPFRSSAMDGYALRASEAHLAGDLRVVGSSSAGHPFAGTVGPGDCIRIMTGAKVPDDLDAVVIQEDCSRRDDTVTVNVAVVPGDNIRSTGHDVRSGAVIVPAGTRVSPFHVAWLAACGVAELGVRRRLRVGIFSTGDELREPGESLAAGQIFDANRYALRAIFGRLPIELMDLGILGDDAEILEGALDRASRTCDAVITSGGVSVGDADLVRQSLERLGTLTFWKLNLKPGKPLAFGRLGSASFIGLPGNPVSTVVTALLLARPVLLKQCGGSSEPLTTSTARLLDPIEHRPGREEFQRGWLTIDRGISQVQVTGDQSSNRLATFATANCLIRIPRHEGDLPAGAEVTVIPFHGLI